MPVLKLRCAVQCYDWGTHGSNSLVARLMSLSENGFKVDPAKPYAELWMGVHKNGPSVIHSTNQPLQAYINENPGVTAAHEHGTIQFLFKKRAEELHAKDPSHYPDNNHKPEMVIALGDFELLCGFRPASEIVGNIENYSEFRSLLKDDGTIINGLKATDEDTRKATLKRLFETYMKTPSAQVSNSCTAMVERLRKEGKHSKLDDLLIRLNSEFPGDIGVFAPLLLNYYTLKGGESAFLGSNMPHAYLAGDCIECMACSDNTIRAGLTPKFKDVQTLCSDLNYTMGPPPHFQPTVNSPSETLYSPNVSEFAVMRIQHNSQTLKEIGASSIMIVVDGSAHLNYQNSEVKLSKGDVVFIGADSSTLPLSTSNDFVAYRAFTPLH